MDGRPQGSTVSDQPGLPQSIIIRNGMPCLANGTNRREVQRIQPSENREQHLPRQPRHMGSCCVVLRCFVVCALHRFFRHLLPHSRPCPSQQRRHLCKEEDGNAGAASPTRGNPSQIDLFLLPSTRGICSTHNYRNAPKLLWIG